MIYAILFLSCHVLPFSSLLTLALAVLVAISEVQHYNSVIHACCKAREWQQAIAMLSFMVEVPGLPSRVEQHGCSVKSWTSQAHPTISISATSLLFSMQVTCFKFSCSQGLWIPHEVEVPPETWSYNAVIGVCQRCKRLGACDRQSCCNHGVTSRVGDIR